MGREKYSAEEAIEVNDHQYIVTVPTGKKVIVRAAKKIEKEFWETVSLNGMDAEPYDPDTDKSSYDSYTFTQLKMSAKGFKIKIPKEYAFNERCIACNKEHSWNMPLRFYTKKEKDLYDYLYPMKGRATYIKNLIREDMKKQNKLKKKQDKEA